MTSKISLKMDEGNELKFQLRINGETSEPDATKPQVRFLLHEKDNGSSMGFVFPVGKSEDNLIVFALPPLTGMVKVGTTYLGKVEVILGTRIFCPQTIEINFTKELSVEVVPVKQEEDKTKMDITDILSEIEKPAAKVVELQQANKKQITLTKGQLQKLLEKRAKTNSQQVKQPTTEDSSKKNSGLKGSLKDLMKSALDD